MNKKIYSAYNRQAVAANNVQRNIADLQAHVNFLVQTKNVEELELLNSKLSSFLDVVKSEYLNTLPDEPEK